MTGGPVGAGPTSPTGPAGLDRLELREGAEVPPRRKVYRTVELFLFSAAGWHPHRIHYDHAYTTTGEGHPGLLVQGPLQAVHLVGALLEALAPGASVRSVRYRHVSPLYAGEEVELRGRVSALAGQGNGATAELWMEKVDGGQRTTVATVEVRLNGPEPGDGDRRPDGTH